VLRISRIISGPLFGISVIAVSAWADGHRNLPSHGSSTRIAARKSIFLPIKRLILLDNG
jgi:hypothetical protein